MDKVHYSSAKDDWCTPEVVLERVRRVGDIGLDPCSNPRSIVNARHSAGRAREGEWRDGLNMGWSGYGLVFLNPPYGRNIGKWVVKCAEADECIALLPARTDTKWFPWDAASLAFWKGRLTFLGVEHPAPFPSVLAYWGYREPSFRDAFRGVAKVVEL